VANLPDVSQNTQTWSTISTILENIAKKSIATKANNSIDVHRLQKNIDNWTIQVCCGFLTNIISCLNKMYTLYTFLEKICLFHNMEISFFEIKILISNFIIFYKYKRNNIYSEFNRERERERERERDQSFLFPDIFCYLNLSNQIIETLQILALSLQDQPR